MHSSTLTRTGEDEDGTGTQRPTRRQTVHIVSPADTAVCLSGVMDKKKGKQARIVPIPRLSSIATMLSKKKKPVGCDELMWPHICLPFHAIYNTVRRAFLTLLARMQQ